MCQPLFAMVYLMVIFTDDNSWVPGNVMYWPPYEHSQRINSAVAKQEVPGHTWGRYPFRVLLPVHSTLHKVQHTMTMSWFPGTE